MMEDEKFDQLKDDLLENFKVTAEERFDILKEVLIENFREYPNSSPAIIILHNPMNGLTAAAICTLRELDKILITTGEDNYGVLLSVDEEAILKSKKFE